MLARLPVLTNIDELKQRISDEWNKIDQQLIDSVVKQWRKRLAACVSARSGHSTCFKVELKTDQQSTAVVHKFCI